MSLLQNSNAISTGVTAYNLTDSVRFRDSASAYLTRTPSSTGNRKTFTLSMWVKRGKLGSEQYLFSAYNADNNNGLFEVKWSSTDSLYFGLWTTGSTSAAKFRDLSSWYHIVIKVDTTLTGSFQVRTYVNNEDVTQSSFSGITVNTDLAVNNTIAHAIGRDVKTSSKYNDGYITEFNLVDGQALTPSDFGEYDDDTGVWKPKKYTGSYGTNGFYLPMKATTQASGFNTVTYAGTGSSGTKITDVGFQPDLVWIKGRNVVNGHGLYDSVRGSGKRLLSHLTNAEDNVTGVSSFDSNGFSLSSTYNTSSETYVAWCWEAGGTAVSNTDGTITSSVSANTAKGFSVVTYTGNGTASTVGHGLGVAPKVMIHKNRSTTTNWSVYHQDIGNNYKLLLNLTNAKSATSNYNTTSPTSSVFSITAAPAGGETNDSGNNYVAYCFAEVSGFSKFGSYTGNGSTSGPTITTGFRPAFIMFKRTDAAQNWIMFDNTRDVDGTLSAHLYADLTNAEASADTVSINDTGFQIVSTGGTVNTSGGSYIYMAFADTRDYQWNFDASGNKNNFTPTNINSNASSETTYDIMSDVPTLTDEDTSNFATLNPLSKGSVITLSEANLRSYNGGAGWTSAFGTIGVSTGKWYWEATLTTAGSINAGLGITSNPSAMANSYIGSTSTSWGYHGYNGTKWNNNSSSAYGATWANGDVIGVALDLDAGTLTFYKNNSSQGTAFSSLPSNTYFPAVSNEYVPYLSFNFGQRPFAYTPPAGYKKLNTYNLPDSTIVDGSQYMNAVTYPGNGGTQSITGVGFSPDLVWVKNRSFANSHQLVDSVRGATKHVFSNTTDEEYTYANGLTSFNTDGFSIGNLNDVNNASYSYVAWNWRGSDSSAVSNTDGDITTLVSANPTAGFSIVTFTGTDVITDTIGHGLGTTPEMMILKSRSIGSGWWVYHKTMGNGKFMYLNTTQAETTSSGVWNNTSPTSTVFVTGAKSAGVTSVAYCFASVEGFSKFGSYTGNSSADGPFIYTGFRPAFIMIKIIDGAGENWIMYDNQRNPYNKANNTLYANTSSAEMTTDPAHGLDMLSNGFKLRNTSSWSDTNLSGYNYLYMAFAESPFKNSLAR